MATREYATTRYTPLPFVTSNDKYVGVMLSGVLPREIWDSPCEFQSGRLLSWQALHRTRSSLSLGNYKCINSWWSISSRKNDKTLSSVNHQSDPQTLQSDTHEFYHIHSIQLEPHGYEKLKQRIKLNETKIVLPSMGSVGASTKSECGTSISSSSCCC